MMSVHGHSGHADLASQMRGTLARAFDRCSDKAIRRRKRKSPGATRHFSIVPAFRSG